MFFNCFDTKESVVFDPDPDEPERWRALMADRPAGEPLWEALQAVMLGYVAMLSDRLAIQKQLKAVSPALAASARDTSDRFSAELREWAIARSGPGDELRTLLVFNTAQAVMATAYGVWAPDQTVEELQRLARRGFDTVAAGLGKDTSP
jgi:AcrR family transcriptional regulator